MHPLGIPPGAQYVSAQTFNALVRTFCDAEPLAAAVVVNARDQSEAVYADDPTAADRFIELLVESTGLQRVAIDRDRITTPPDHRGTRMCIFPSLYVRPSSG